MLIGFGDSFVAAKYSTDTIAAVGIALGVINPPFLFGIGVLSAISPMLAMRRGKGENTDNFFHDCLVMSLLIFVMVLLITFGLKSLVPLLGVSEHLLKDIDIYIEVTAWSFLPAYIYQAAREFLQAKEEVFFPNLLAILCVFLNVALNFVMVFGMYGVPEMGIAGTAWCSVIVRSLMAIAMLFYLSYRPKIKTDFGFIKSMLKFGLPVGVMFLLEVTAFCLVSILAGKFGVVEAATNTIVLNMGSLAFMIPLSLSFALAVKVGKHYGAGNFIEVKRFISSAVLVTCVVMSFTVFIFTFFPENLIRIFTDDPKVITLGLSLFVLVALFQLFDGIQVILAGALRGLGTTREVSISAIVGYWVIGLPFGIWLAFEKNMGPHGLWTGLAISLFILSICLFFLVRKKLKTLV